MRIRFNILFIVSFFTFSCNNSSKIINELKNLKSQEITLPYNATAMLDGKDTTITDFMYSELKLVVYTDSIGCASCGLSKMYMWNDFINYAKVYSGRLKYYFIYAPAANRTKEVKQILQGNRYNYPILLDTAHEFEKLNPHLPKNKALHTFLLDENNNVILVGNPLHNAQIEQMFYKKVEEKLNNDE